MPGAGEEIVCKESLLAKKERKQSVACIFCFHNLYPKLFLRENGANRKFLMLCDILQKVNIQASKKF